MPTTAYKRREVLVARFFQPVLEIIENFSKLKKNVKSKKNDISKYCFQFFDDQCGSVPSIPVAVLGLSDGNI